MKIINTIFGVPLGYLMYFCFKVTNNYGLAIILFTIISKVILLPLSLIVQKNSIKMVKIQPQLDEIKRYYSGDKDKIAEEQIRLYEQEKYSPAMGCLPTLLQIPIILGLLNVIYNPLQHLLHLGKNIVEPFLIITQNYYTGIELGSTAELRIVELLHQKPELFTAIIQKGLPYKEAFVQIQGLDLHFLGIDLSAIPSIRHLNLLFLIPVFSGLSALILCIAQNRLNVLQREQSNGSKWGMTIFLVIFSTYFAFIVPAGVGLYWIAGNLMAILIIILCNIIYNPKKYIDYENRYIPEKLSKEEKRKLKQKNKEYKEKERIYIKKFENDSIPKEIVIYAEGSGYYKYFAHFIEYIVNHSDIIIHYITSDPEDPILVHSPSQVEPYYVGSTAVIPFMMKLDADIVLMTTPDLEKYHLKRSLVRKDTEYIYTDHGMTSLHLTLREGALDHYDTIFCCGPNHVEEIRALEETYNLPPKYLVRVGYGLLDKMLDSYENEPKLVRSKKRILIAPSWQIDNILDSCIDVLLKELLNKDYEIVLRPHPEYIKRFPDKMKKIIDTYENVDENFTIETDFSSNSSVFTSDLVITDWSSIAQEFSYTTKKPSVFINTPMKIINPEYQRIPQIPLDISLRDEIGISVDIEQLDHFQEIIENLFTKYDEYELHITKILSNNIYNIGCSGEVGGKYLIRKVEKYRSLSDRE